jgi:recombinational DNA repair protein RecR
MKETKRNNAKRVAEINKEHQIIKIWRSIADCAEQENLNEKHLSACCRGERRSTNNRFFCWVDDNNNLLIPNYIGYQYKGKDGTTQI